MGSDPSTLQVIWLAGLVGLAVVVGFRVALWTNASPWLLSCCVGLIVGIILGTIIFEFLPALNNQSTSVLAKISVGVIGFIAAWVVHAFVRSGLPDPDSFSEARMSFFILAVVIDDVVEGVTLGFTRLLSAQLLLFSAVIFSSKNILEGFTEASVMRWNGSRASRIWAAAFAAAMAVVAAAAVAVWLGLGETSRTLLFAAATGMLLYVSVVQLARNLEWNKIQMYSALIGFAGTGIISLLLVNE